MPRKRRLGEILIAEGLINETQLAAALQSQRTWGGKVGSTLVRMGFVREEDILNCLSSQLRLPSLDFGKVKISPRAIQTIPLRIAEKYNVIPVALKEEQNKKSVILAMSDPTNLDALSEIQFQTGVQVRPVVATESGITRAIDRYYRRRGAREEGSDRRVDLAELDAGEEMVILERGEEKKIANVEGADSAELLRALIQVLEEKGVLTKGDLQAVLRQKP